MTPKSLRLYIFITCFTHYSIRYIWAVPLLRGGGVNIDSRFFKVREYFFHHAEEEQDHWKWIIQNLYDTGYKGSDPRILFPQIPTQAYLSFAMYLAHKQPVARLAMGYILEGVSGELGVQYGNKAAQLLGLNKEQMSFFILHGELDQGHSHDILDILENAPLSGYDWAWCEYAAKCTVELYKAMYNHAAIDYSLV
ncbi:MAG: iron-containing redox enzyme family protein [Chitinophagales bacterium]